MKYQKLSKCALTNVRVKEIQDVVHIWVKGGYGGNKLSFHELKKLISIAKSCQKCFRGSHWSCFIKKFFLKTLQNSKENPCVAVLGLQLS